jgi:hypothetical protein
VPDFLIFIRNSLWTVLLTGLAALGVLLVVLVAVRLWDKVEDFRKRRLIARYQKFIDALAEPSQSAAALAFLQRCPRAHLDVIGSLILRPLELTSGQGVDYLRAGATALGLEKHWRAGLRSRRWWDRANAVHALGLLRKPGIGQEMVRLLDDPHEEVRAAAVAALGWLADPATVPELLKRLSDETRHQRVRIIEALQQAGAAAGPAVLAYLDAQPRVPHQVADMVGHLRLPAAMDHFLRWTGDDDPALRAAAFRAIGILGPDERAFYHALKGLGDSDARVRAMAARTLGRSGLGDAVPYLAAQLDTEWSVAVEAALALRTLGPSGMAALESRASGEGDAAEMVRHVLWEGRLHAGTPG